MATLSTGVANAQTSSGNTSTTTPARVAFGSSSSTSAVDDEGSEPSAAEGALGNRPAPPAAQDPQNPTDQEPGDLIPENSKSVFSQIATARKDIPPPAGQAPTSFGNLPDDFMMTQWGPLSPADKSFLVAVRLAGLWEEPAGQQAAAKGRSPLVREMGGHIAIQHNGLDQRVRAVSQQLNVDLPNKVSGKQAKMLANMEKARGDDFDWMFANYLRQAHGGIFPVIADVRAGTKNELVRTLASETSDIVLGHIAMLESTGLVDYSALPAPYHPQTITVMQSMKALFASAGTGNLWLQMVLGLIILGVSLTTWRMFRPGPKIKQRKAPVKARKGR